MDDFKNDEIKNCIEKNEVLMKKIYVPVLDGDDEIEFGQIYNETYTSEYQLFKRLSLFFQNRMDFNLDVSHCREILHKGFNLIKIEKDIRCFEILWVIVHLLSIDCTLWCDIKKCEISTLLDYIDTDSPTNIVSQVLIILDTIVKNDQAIPELAKRKLIEYFRFAVEQQLDITTRVMQLLMLLLVRDSEPSELVADFIGILFDLVFTSNPDVQFKSLESILKLVKHFEGFNITEEQANILLTASELKNVGIVEKSLSIISILISNGENSAAFLACDGIKRISELSLFMYPKILQLIALIFEHAANVSKEVCAICVEYTSFQTISNLPFIAKFPMLRFLATAVQRYCIQIENPLYKAFLNCFIEDCESLNPETIEQCLDAFYFTGVSGVCELEEEFIEALTSLSEDDENYSIKAENILKFIESHHIPQL